MLCCSAYGNYRTRKFTDIFSDVNSFISEYKTNGIPQSITEQNANTLYYLLYARFGNTPIANSDENQFKYKLFSVVFMYGPAWEKRLEIQNNLRQLTENDLLSGAKQINNFSNNPSTEPSTADLEELPTVNSQTTTHFKKSKLDAYNLLWNLLATDVTERFISEFAKLFIKVATPQVPLWYASETEQGEEL